MSACPSGDDGDFSCDSFEHHDESSCAPGVQVSQRSASGRNGCLQRAADCPAPPEEKGPAAKGEGPSTGDGILVRELAVDGISVTVTCEVIGLCRQAYYRWKSDPVTDRDWNDAHLVHALRQAHADDPEFGYRFLADEVRDAGTCAPTGSLAGRSRTA